MKNSKLMKIFLVMVVSLCLVFVATNVFAADDDGFVDLTNTLGNNTNTEENTNNAVDNNAALDENVNTANNTNTSLNDTTTTNNTNSSSYNNANVNTNTNLPSTGIGESGTTIALIVVLAISGVYAYKKVRDYKNI